MEKLSYENAVDDLSMIKQVIKKTRKSFSGLGILFIIWGLLFTLNSIYTSYLSGNQDELMDFFADFPFAMFLVPLLMVIMATVVYKVVAKKHTFVGLEKQILLMWILLLFSTMMPVRVNILNSGLDMNNPITIEVNQFANVAFTLAIGLIMTSVLTDLRQLKYVGLSYIALAVLYGFFNISWIVSIIDILVYILVPFTLIYTGVYLKKLSERGTVNGSELNS